MGELQPETEGGARSERIFAPGRLQALERVQGLYEISELLAEFRSIDHTVPEVLAIADRALSLASAVLITEVEGRPKVLRWGMEGASEERKEETVARARTCYAYLTGAAPAGALEQGPAPGDRPGVAMAPEAPLRSIALPLVVDHERVFGLLQLETTAVDEPSLFFASTMTHQIAATIARHLAWRQEVALRRRAEALEHRHRVLADALRASEEKLAGIVSLAADAIVSTDAEHRIVLFNAAAETMFGYLAKEVLGDPIDRLLPARHRALHRARLARFARGAAPTHRRDENDGFVGKRKNGEDFPMEVSISKLSAGGAWTFTMVLRDVTEQKRVEDERRFFAAVGATLTASLDYRETLASIAALSVGFLADCCVVKTIEEDGRTLSLTVADADPERYELACELSRVRLVQPLFSSAPPGATAGPRPVLVSEVPPGYYALVAHSEEHLRVLRAIGPRSLIATPLVARDRLLGELVFARTRPERRYGSADLRAAEELARLAALAIDNARLYRDAQRAVRGRDEVLGMVAHDLRDPLHTIDMAARMVANPAAPTSPDLVRLAMSRITRSTGRMQRLIGDLLDITRIEAGQLSVEKVRCAPAQLVREAEEAARAATIASSLLLDSSVEEGLPFVAVDRDRILQVLSNLVGNAVKFTPAGGRVRIGAARGPVGVRFWVSDTGSGIPAESLAHVFDRFWQASGGDRRGAGLGLAICSGIVEAHGGRIEVESEVGRGSTFSVTFPGMA